MVEADFPPELAAEDEDWALLELGVEVDRGPALGPGVAEAPEDSSSRDEAPVDFLLDFRLETLFLLSMSDSLMLLPLS